MTASAARATAVSFDEAGIWMTLADGRVIGIPLAWFPRLLAARPQQREAAHISSPGLHWESVDEDISVAGLLNGFGDQTMHKPNAA